MTTVSVMLVVVSVVLDSETSEKIRKKDNFSKRWLVVEYIG